MYKKRNIGVVKPTGKSFINDLDWLRDIRFCNNIQDSLDMLYMDRINPYLNPDWPNDKKNRDVITGTFQDFERNELINKTFHRLKTGKIQTFNSIISEMKSSLEWASFRRKKMLCFPPKFNPEAKYLIDIFEELPKFRKERNPLRTIFKENVLKFSLFSLCGWCLFSYGLYSYSDLQATTQMFEVYDRVPIHFSEKVSSMDWVMNQKPVMHLKSVIKTMENDDSVFSLISYLEKLFRQRPDFNIKTPARFSLLSDGIATRLIIRCLHADERGLKSLRKFVKSFLKGYKIGKEAFFKNNYRVLSNYFKTIEDEPFTALFLVYKKHQRGYGKLEQNLYCYYKVVERESEILLLQSHWETLPLCDFYFPEQEFLDYVRSKKRRPDESLLDSFFCLDSVLERFASSQFFRFLEELKTNSTLKTKCKRAKMLNALRNFLSESPENLKRFKDQNYVFKRANAKKEKRKIFKNTDCVLTKRSCLDVIFIRLIKIKNLTIRS